MSGEKETPKKTTNDAIKGPSVVTSTYDWLDPERMETQLINTQNYLKATSEDFTPFDEIGESIDSKLNKSLEVVKQHITKKLLKLEKVVINQEEYYQWVNTGEPRSAGNLFKDWRDIPREKLKLIRKINTHKN